MIALAGVERLGAVERTVVADLRSDDEALDRLRDFRLVVYAEGEGTVGRPAAADGGGGKGTPGVDNALAPPEPRPPAALFVAPNLAPSDQRDRIAQDVDG